MRALRCFAVVCWSVAAVVLLAVVCVGSLIDATRRLQRWAAVYQERPWLKLMSWTLVLTAAAFIGAVVGGATDGLLAVILVAGLVVLYIAYEFWLGASMNGFWRDSFRG